MSSWITNFIRPKVKTMIGTRADKPNGKGPGWLKCTGCEQFLYKPDLAKQFYVCSKCGHHLRMPVEDRLKLIYGDNAYERVAIPSTVSDPLKFKDTKRYTDRLKAARNKTKDEDALNVAFGHLAGYPLVTAVFNFDFMGGSMGAAVGEAFVTAASMAIEKNAGMLLISSSGGARMQEGGVSLMQLPRTIIAINKLAEAGLPYIVLLCDPTTGGVTASVAMLGDIHLAEPKALIGFAGQRVIMATARVELPEGFQRAEFLVEHGFVDQIVNRRFLHNRLCALLNLMMTSNSEAAPLEHDFDNSQLNYTGMPKQPAKSLQTLAVTDAKLAPDAVSVPDKSKGKGKSKKPPAKKK